MINITFIGNCQMVSLCYFFQRLLDVNKYNVKWVCYGKDFQRVGKRRWANKCLNKILNYNDSIERLKISDVVIYQIISLEKSLFSNPETLKNIVLKHCKLITLPSIHINYRNFKQSLKELQRREQLNNIDVTVSDIIVKHTGKNLMVNDTSIKHPSTFFFMEIMKKLCKLLEVDFFSEAYYKSFMRKKNYMQLP